MNMRDLQPDGSPYPPITVKRWSGIIEGGMEYRQDAVGRNNWTCAIPAGDIAEFVCSKHVKFWDDLKDCHKQGSVVRDSIEKQLQFWELWHDFLLSINPKTKLPLTLEDYRFFYRDVGHARELSE